jgi:hypothetical protein
MFSEPFRPLFLGILIELLCEIISEDCFEKSVFVLF